MVICIKITITISFLSFFWLQHCLLLCLLNINIILSGKWRKFCLQTVATASCYNSDIASQVIAWSSGRWVNISKVLGCQVQMRTYALQLAATSVRWPRPDDKVILRLLFMRGWPSQLINNIFAAWVASHSAAHLCVQFFAHIFHGAHVALSACTITNSWMPLHTATQPPNHLFLYAFSSWVAHFIVQEECGGGGFGAGLAC